MTDEKRTAARVLLGLAAGALLLLAGYLSASDPHLTYSSEVGEDLADIEVVCGRDEANLQPLLDDGRMLRTHYEIIGGKDRIDRVETKAAEVVDPRDRPAFTIERGINADCARAEAERFRWVVWLLAGAAGSAIGAVALRAHRLTASYH